MKALAMGLVLLAAPLEAAAAPAISFERDAVVARGISVGAWQLRVGDGGASDEDGEPDGTLSASLSSLTPVREGDPPAPVRFSPRDVLLVIDSEHMEFATVRIGEPK